MPVTSTFQTTRQQTYAQNRCMGAMLLKPITSARYKRDSDVKLLIYNNKLICLFHGHFSESLDLQGFATFTGKLSTKLSTENLHNSNAALNQRLSALSACKTTAAQNFFVVS